MRAQPIFIHTACRKAFRQLKGAILRGEPAMNGLVPTDPVTGFTDADVLVSLTEGGGK